MEKNEDLIDVSNPMYAEALFDFCTDYEELDYNDRAFMAESDLSFAEYVCKYKLKQFSTWYRCHYA